MIKLGVLPVRSLLMMEDTLWAASGGQVSVISVETHAVEVSHFKWLHSAGRRTSEPVRLTSQADVEDRPSRVERSGSVLPEALCGTKIPPSVA